MKIRKGKYNVRIIVEDDGRISLGYVDRLYERKNGHWQGHEWKGAPDSTRIAIETALIVGTKGNEKCI